MKGEIRQHTQNQKLVTINSMTPKEIKQNRIEATFRFEKTDRIPTLMFPQGWSYDYAGVRRCDVIHDPAACADAATKYLDDFDLDISAFYEVNLPAIQALGCTNYYWAPNGSSVQHDQVSDRYCGADKYPAYIADPMGFMQNEGIKPRVPAFSLPKEQAYEALKNAAKEVKYAGAVSQMVAQKFDEKGVLNAFAAPGPYFNGPFGQIFGLFRGIKEALLDLRRRPEMVAEACDAYMEQASHVFGFKKTAEEVNAAYPEGLLRMGVSILNPEAFLSPAQFDKYYMQYFKKYLTPYMEAGFTFFINGEGDMRRIIDQFADLPKGSICMMLCQNTTEEIAPALAGKQTIVAGIHMNDLRVFSKEECIDIAKRNIDTYGRDGGFIFGHNSCLMNGSDVKTENLKAVYDFALEYGK